MEAKDYINVLFCHPNFSFSPSRADFGRDAPFCHICWRGHLRLVFALACVFPFPSFRVLASLFGRRRLFFFLLCVSVVVRLGTSGGSIRDSSRAGGWPQCPFFRLLFLFFGISLRFFFSAVVVVCVCVSLWLPLLLFYSFSSQNPRSNLGIWK
ncbi:hypothetical protein HDK77DRAFT_233501 [Phyllosticta capitalensis]